MRKENEIRNILNFYYFILTLSGDIKVMIDRALQDVKWRILSHNKNLYLPSMRGSDALCLMVNVAPDATEEQRKEALMSREVDKFRTEFSEYSTTIITIPIA